MNPPKADAIDLLLAELQYLDLGVYGDRKDGGTFRLFQDSPSCPNFHKRAWERIPCDECPLLQFVPPHDRDELYPCQSIPLNAQKETPEMLFYWGTKREMKTKLRDWLLREIFRRSEARRPHATAPNDAT
jgi:hypothetical protein